jgi:transcriptional regulator with XRE-family HTH domain
MAPPSGESVTTLLILAMNALGVSQEGLGNLLGMSRRTVSRWMSRGSASLSPADCDTVARAVYPLDPGLAARLVATRGATLEDAGIVSPRPAAAPPPPPPQPYLVDVVVCAAAEALDASPRLVRPALLAALKSARAVGLDMETMEKALSAPGDGKRAHRKG